MTTPLAKSPNYQFSSTVLLIWKRKTHWILISWLVWCTYELAIGNFAGDTVCTVCVSVCTYGYEVESLSHLLHSCK